MTCCDTKIEGSLQEPTFKPDFSEKPLTEKFYARHDQYKFQSECIENLKEYEKATEYWKTIEGRKPYELRQHPLAPITENQVYGWLPDLSQKVPTEKCYPRHTQSKLQSILMKKAKQYEKTIEERQHFDFRQHRLTPITENQEYGWLEYAAFKYDDPLDRPLFKRGRTTDEGMKVQGDVIAAMNMNRKWNK